MNNFGRDYELEILSLMIKKRETMNVNSESCTLSKVTIL